MIKEAVWIVQITRIGMIFAIVCRDVILTIKTALMRNQTIFIHMEVHYNSAQAQLRLGLRCGSACGQARAAIWGFRTALLAFKSHSQSGQQRQQH